MIDTRQPQGADPALEPPISPDNERHFSVHGNGPPVIFIHGVGADRTSWRAITSLLSNDFTCICYDLPGHGLSPKPELPMTLDDLVSDLENLRAQLNFSRVHLCGNSLGAMVACGYARRFPDRVMSLALISTAAFRSPEDSARLRDSTVKIRKQGVVPLLDSFISRWFTDEFVRARPEIVDARKKQLLATDNDVFADAFRLYAETEMSPWLNEVSVRSLVMTGECDVNCSPRLNVKLSDALHASRMIVVPQMKHGLILEAPDRVSQEVRLFFRQGP